MSFYVACGIGAFINVAIAEWLYLQSVKYWVAGLAGALIAAVWNFFTTASFTWAGRPTSPDAPGAWPAAIVAVLLFALYAASAPRAVALEDDAFFVLASLFPGGGGTRLLPAVHGAGQARDLAAAGTVAYRVHLLSGLFGAASCVALWACARALLPGRLAPSARGAGAGLSPAFWSQAIIAEVYTLNTLFAFRAAVAGAARGAAVGDGAAVWPQPVNHWPLMLLVAPAYAVLLWPRRQEILPQVPKLFFCCLAGLLPYAWMVWRSWTSPIAF